jgi:hypothetical protein
MLFSPTFTGSPGTTVHGDGSAVRVGALCSIQPAALLGHESSTVSFTRLMLNCGTAPATTVNSDVLVNRAKPLPPVKVMLLANVPVSLAFSHFAWSEALPR